jgi:hypothetical protein
MNESKPIVVIPTKSPGIAMLLACMFGPVGMLYSTILGAIVMLLLHIIVFIPSIGLGLLITWPIGVLWAGLAAHFYNRKLLAQR